ncbi:MAG: hypothetical protein QOF69_200 [Solirubrobacteraceae bacterium]|nr:hypothetical protein [Solirubrobacteraceae bacterium]
MDIRRLGIALGVACACALVAAGASAASTSPGVCLAATGSNGWCGDGFPATRAKLAVPRDVAPLPGGGFLIADSANHVIRRVDGRGAITTIAGTGTAGHPVYGRRASASFLGTPTGVAPLARRQLHDRRLGARGGAARHRRRPSFSCGRPERRFHERGRRARLPRAAAVATRSRGPARRRLRDRRRRRQPSPPRAPRWDHPNACRDRCLRVLRRRRSGRRSAAEPANGACGRDRRRAPRGRPRQRADQTDRA